MASKRRIRRRSCEGKKGHATQAEAVSAAAALRRSHQGGSWRAYRCEFCGRWHVGRQSANDRRSMWARRAAAAE